VAQLDESVVQLENPWLKWPMIRMYFASR